MGGYTLPLVSLEVDRYSSETVGGVPIGTVIAWPSNSSKPEGGIWLECTGQSCAKYSGLVAVLGKSTVPDYRGRFLEGAATAGTVKEAGLPNITGSMDNRQEGLNGVGGLEEPLSFADYITFTGAFKRIALKDVTYGFKVNTGGSATELRAWGFDASRSNKIYGASTTVQPPSVTVRYFIKAE